MAKTKRSKQKPSSGSPPADSRDSMFKRRKPWVIGLTSLAVMVFLVLAGICWYYAGEIYAGGFEIDHSPDELNLQVVAIGDGTITLQASEGTSDLEKPGVFGLRGDNGYGRVHNIISVVHNRVVREFQPVDGELKAGDRVTYDRYAFPGDPGQAFNLPFQDVTYQSPLGPMRAWFVPGYGDTWAVMVHGRTATRGETLRSLGLVSNVGIPVMSIQFRNDEGVAEDPTGRYQYGNTEWEDLQGAVEYVLDNGAENVVLMGFSMGGGIVTHFMDESALAYHVSGIVLDAPLLNLDDAVDLSGSKRGVPQPIPTLATFVAKLRYGIDWSALDTRDEFHAIRQPVLMFHGTEDPTIPVSQSDAVAERSGANVTYIRMEGAEHVGSWNIDPEAYAAVLFKWFNENILP
jgi:alpha-beta hydrolase superfamily lysophospholipase